LSTVGIFLKIETARWAVYRFEVPFPFAHLRAPELTLADYIIDDCRKASAILWQNRFGLSRIIQLPCKSTASIYRPGENNRRKCTRRHGVDV
jgi:hypothetical protein